MQKPVAGFTTIELVATIVLLAILAAVALPRFVRLSDSAHLSSVKATAGALQSAVSMAHAVWRIHGDSREVGNLAEYADGSFNFNDFGYPYESADNRSGGTINTGPSFPNTNMCGRVWNGLLAHSPPLDISGEGSRQDGAHSTYFSVDGGDYAVQTAVDRRCEYVCLAEPTLRIVYDTTQGSVTVLQN